MKYLVPLLFVAALAGCSFLDVPQHVCTLEARAGIMIHVSTAAGTDAGAAEDALAVARQGTFVDSSRVAMGAAALVFERPGVYTVEVTQPGYAPWHREDVVVESDECHVQTVRLEARLQPAGR